MSPDGSNAVLALANGKQVLPDGRVVSTVAVPQPSAQIHREIVSGRQAAKTLDRIHRKLGDLPDIPQKMNPIAAVLSYTAIGLSDADIATALGAAVEQIQVLKDSEPYKQLADMFDKTVFEDARKNAKHIIARAADRAATKISDAIDSDDPLISLAASRDIIKFGGISLDESTGRSLGGLKIVIEKSDGKNADNVTVTLGESHG